MMRIRDKNVFFDHWGGPYDAPKKMSYGEMNRNEYANY